MSSRLPQLSSNEGPYRDIGSKILYAPHDKRLSLLYHLGCVTFQALLGHCSAKDLAVLCTPAIVAF